MQKGLLPHAPTPQNLYWLGQYGHGGQVWEWGLAGIYMGGLAWEWAVQCGNAWLAWEWAVRCGHGVAEMGRGRPTWPQGWSRWLLPKRTTALN